MKSCIIDTETTNLISNSGMALEKQPRIIEFSGLLIEDDGTVIDQLDFLCNPGIQISAEITKITGLTNNDLKDKAPFKDHADKVMDFINKGDAVVAHNLSYDYSLVNFELERIGFREVFAWPSVKICTVEATEYIKGFRLSLTALHEYLFGMAFTGAHRAAEDVKALAKCYVELRNRGVI